MEIDFNYALDDDCQVNLFTRGHVEDEDEFRCSCEMFYLENFEKYIDMSVVPVKHIYWRNVSAPGDCIVGDRQLVESKKGPGAFPVTLLDKWLPM